MDTLYHVKSNGLYLKNIPDLCDDKEIVLAAVTQNGWALRYASPRLQDCEEVVIAAVTNIKPVRVVVSTQGVDFYSTKASYYSCVGVCVANDEDPIAGILRYASNRLKHKRSLVLTSVAAHGGSLKIHPMFCDDKDVVLAAVSNDGNSLRYASERLKDDIEIVTSAVENSQRCVLLYASSNLQNNRELILKTVRHNGYSIRLLSPYTHVDFEIMLTAIKNTGDALKYADHSLLANSRFIRRVIGAQPNFTEYNIYKNIIHKAKFIVNDNRLPSAVVDEVLVLLFRAY